MRSNMNTNLMPNKISDKSRKVETTIDSRLYHLITKSGEDVKSNDFSTTVVVPGERMLSSTHYNNSNQSEVHETNHGRRP